MRKIFLVALLTLPAAPALADVQITNDRGGKAVVARDCTRGDATATCTVQTDVTGAQGNTASKTRVRTTEPGMSRSEVTLTGPEGNVRTRERVVTWGN
jgi:outer membrane protein assembly factor BamE (lipoprotein component of BamABCDE complex)